MSVPNPDFEQLLSDHLDGRLAEQDAQVLEDQLRENPEMSEQLSAMIQDRAQLRALFQGSWQSLPSDFAPRVVAEAQVRAQEAGCAASHPLNQIPTPQPASLSVAESVALNRTRLVAAILTTAAAITLVVAWRNHDNSPTPLGIASSNGLASSNVDPSETQNGLPIENELIDPLEVERNAVITPSEAASTSLANGSANQPSLDKANAAVSITEPSKNALAMASDSPVSSDTPLASDNATSQRVVAPADPLDMNASDIVSMNLDSLTGAIMVYDVRLTENGKASDAVTQAMHRAGLAETSKQTVSEEIVRVAKGVETLNESDKFRILFLNAPTAAMDRLLFELLGDEEGVESLSMAFAMDAPIAKFVKDLRKVDPTQLEPVQVSYELESQEARDLQQLGFVLQDRDFFPVQPRRPQVSVDKGSKTQERTPKTGNPATDSLGKDVMSQVLVLIR